MASLLTPSLSSVSLENATAEDKLVALSNWWHRHCKTFTTWFLSLSSLQQKQIIVKAVPDIPETSCHERLSQEVLKVTDLILPEFSLDGMLSTGGRIFILFMTRRLVGTDLCLQEDLRLLNELYAKKQLPSLSNGALEGLDTPFVNPMDPEENIRSLSSDTQQETREIVNNYLTLNRYIHAEVWLALKVRRTAIATLLEVMAEEHFAAATIKPSPTYQSLLMGELIQQSVLANQASENVEEHQIVEEK